MYITVILLTYYHWPTFTSTLFLPERPISVLFFLRKSPLQWWQHYRGISKVAQNHFVFAQNAWNDFLESLPKYARPQLLPYIISRLHFYGLLNEVNISTQTCWLYLIGKAFKFNFPCMRNYFSIIYKIRVLKLFTLGLRCFISLLSVELV